jgi:hypothetical protein
MVATPPTSVLGEPTAVPSTLKTTLPVGAPAPGSTGATVAEQLTGVLASGLGGVQTRAVVVDALFTTWLVVPVETAERVSPP